ncbi:Uncharacterized protein FWK35_00035367 [Aphis craccivora]|uniref:Uncharacterized protein n=1 Tax=Aphis craccivora TaxID=307492 RepID=A0A6G0ZGA2_APHCR|nr:Uncharacterized protein FWK35_00035367 [Aphis craccivora]
MHYKNCYIPYGLCSISIIIVAIFIACSTYWYCPANPKIDEKHLVIDKAKSIVRQLDVIDDIIFSHSPIYNFIKIKINAAVDAMDNEGDDLAVEYFTDALLLIGPNQKVLRLMHHNLPRHIITKIKHSYGKYLEEVDDIET